jgi:hypothetical protein
MYSGFFLRLRCDTQPQTRDLAAEAADLIKIPKPQFESRFQTGLGWLNGTRGHSEFRAYRLSSNRKPRVTGVLPILLITSSCKNRVTRWLADYDIPDQALMGTYQFHVDGKPYPSYITMEPPTRLASLKDG